MFSAGIERALRVAFEAHDGQSRKGGDVPYMSHPVHVALILARLGADDHVLQAAILHDVVEDCDEWTIERIDSDFGSQVADIVGELTENKDHSWVERKRRAVDDVASMSTEALSVKAADKLHNLSTLLAELEQADDPLVVWSHFSGGAEGTLRVAHELVEALRGRVAPSLGRALDDTLVGLQQFYARGNGS